MLAMPRCSGDDFFDEVSHDAEERDDKGDDSSGEATTAATIWATTLAEKAFLLYSQSEQGGEHYKFRV